MKTHDERPTQTRAQRDGNDSATEVQAAPARPADGFRAWLAAGAHRRWQSALGKTAWGRAGIRPVLLTEHGERQASATQYDFVAVLDGRAIRARGFSDVVAAGDATDVAGGEAARQRLVAHLVADAVGNGIEVVLLFSPLDPAWCREHGFADITPETLTLEVQPGRRPGAPMVMIRAGEDRDLPALAAMGHLQAAPFRFSLDRGADFIHHGIISRRLMAGLAPAGACELHFFVVEEGSTAVAYVVLSVAGGDWWIEACGDRDPTGHRVGCILQALLARDPSAAPPRIRGWIPESLVPPQVTVIARERTPTTVMAALIGGDAPVAPLTAEDVLYWKADVF